MQKSSIRTLRYAVQLAFVFLTLMIGMQFARFVRYYETPGLPFVDRPDSVDAFLPIGGLAAFKYYLLTGIVDAIHPAALIMFVAIICVSFVTRKGFCGWICPVGTVSQWFWMLGQRLLGRTFRMPRWLDHFFRSIKYLLLGFFVFMIGVTMSSDSLASFLTTDYYKTVDVRMLKFFTEMTATTLWILIVIGALSLLYKNVWCRYLCPYGALLGLFGRFSPFRIRRHDANCIHCHACSRHCPSLIDVERSATVTSVECFGCLTCVSRCPANGALELSVPVGRSRRSVPPLLFPVLLIVLFYLIIGIAMLTGNWHANISVDDYLRLIPAILLQYY